MNKNKNPGRIGLNLKLSSISIMLDLIMPGMSGWDTYEKIKQIGDVHKVPIIIYTASDNPDDRIRAKKMGVVDYIKKPCKKDELLNRIGAVIEKNANSI